MLATDYRPTQIKHLAGQDSAKTLLLSLAHSGQLPSAFLFSGPSGTGKTSAARAFAALINCESPQGSLSCEQCGPCFQTLRGTSQAVYELDAASHGGIEDVRLLQELSQFSVSEKWRVIILDEVHSMSKAAFNSLLKILEEPPASTIFLLLTTEPDKILETVRSRCMPIPFRSVPDGETLEWLKLVAAKENLDTPLNALEEIVRLSGGSVREALVRLDQAHRAGGVNLDVIHRLSGHFPVAPLLIRAFLTQDHVSARKTLDGFFESSGDVSLLLSDLIEQFQLQFASNAISPQQMIAATKLLWGVRGVSLSARDLRLHTEALVTLLYGVFYVEPKIVQPILRETPPLKSVEEMVAVAEE